MVGRNAPHNDAPLTLSPIRAGNRRENRRLAGSLGTSFTVGLALVLALSACTKDQLPGAERGEQTVNVFPEHYKTDITAAMHAYLNDPTGIRDAMVSPPELKEVGNANRYISCLKFSPKKNATQYAPTREIVAVFLLGRFDQFLENPRDLCKTANYAPFPELQKLPP
jgi:hypothetical protein